MKCSQMPYTRVNMDEAKEFFSVDSLQEIVIEINSTSEGGKGRADEFIEKYKKLRERN